MIEDIKKVKEGWLTNPFRPKEIKLKEKEIEELTIWLKENEYSLNKFNVKRLKKNIYHRKFVNCKIDGNYKACLNILLNSGFNLLNLKNLIIFLLPVAILKKLLWYHQD